MTLARGRIRGIIIALIVALACLCMLAAPSRATSPLAVHTPSIASSAAPAISSNVSANTSARTPIVLVGIGGLSMDYLSKADAPALTTFLKESAAANLTEKTTGETTCPSSAWLTIGAGVRTAASVPPCWNPSVSPTQAADNSTTSSAPSKQDVSAGQAHNSTTDPQAKLTHWYRISTISQNTAYGSFTPALTLFTRMRGVNTLALGTGAAVAVADLYGNVYTHYAPLPDYALEASSDDPGELFRAAYTGENFILADLGNLRFPDAPLGSGEATSAAPNSLTLAARSAFEGVPELPTSSREALKRLDSAFASFTAAVREALPDAEIMLASTGDAQDRSAHLGVFAWGNAHGNTQGIAYSPSTRTKGLVQLTDITPTLLNHYGAIVPTTLTGSVIEVLEGKDSTPTLASDATRAHEVRPLVGPYYIAFYSLWAVVTLLSLRTLSRAKPLSPGLQQCLTLVAGIPTSSFLVNLMPWWLAPSPTLALFSGILVIACILAVIAQMKIISRHRYGPLCFYGAITFLTLSIDVIVSAITHTYSLQLASLAGAQPQLANRFYGLSNVPFALFATGGFAVISVLAFLFATRPRALAAFLGVTSLILVFIDATPSLGADFGGSPGILVGACALYFFVGRRPWKWWHIFPVAFIAAIPPFVFAIADYFQPANHRSHLGRFINSALNSGAADIVARKLSAIAFGLPWFVALAGIFLLVAACIAVYIWALKAASRHTLHIRHTPLQASALALACMLLVSLTINDSGIAIPFTGLSFISPLWILAYASAQSAEKPNSSAVDVEDNAEGGDEGYASAEAHNLITDDDIDVSTAG